MGAATCRGSSKPGRWELDPGTTCTGPSAARSAAERWYAPFPADGVRQESTERTSHAASDDAHNIDIASQHGHLVDRYDICVGERDAVSADEAADSGGMAITCDDYGDHGDHASSAETGDDPSDDDLYDGDTEASELHESGPAGPLSSKLNRRGGGGGGGGGSGLRYDTSHRE